MKTLSEKKTMHNIFITMVAALAINCSAVVSAHAVVPLIPLIIGGGATLAAGGSTGYVFWLNRKGNNCEKMDATKNDTNDLLFQSSSDFKIKSAFKCDGSYCNNGAMILMGGGHYFKGNPKSKPQIYYCRQGATSVDQWYEYAVTDLPICDGCGEVSVPSNAIAVDGFYLFDTSGGKSGVATGSGNVMSAQSTASICRCSKKDIEDAKNKDKDAECKKKFGDSVKWDPKANSGKGECVCEDSNLKLVNDKCVDPKQAEDDCKKKESKGFEWKDNECKCKDPKKSPNKEGTACVFPPAPKPQNQKNCEVLGPKGSYGIVFMWENGECKCKNGFELVVINNEGTCPDPDKEQMDLCKKAGASVARWDAVAKECVCLDSPAKEWKYDRCEETAASIEARNKAAAAQCASEIKSLTAQIESSSLAIKSIRGPLVLQLSEAAKADYTKKRVISDTVAGAVLGTGGGFLVHNIVKKKQVEKGFDSISCKIDGTIVGGWGDQFGITYNR